MGYSPVAEANSQPNKPHEAVGACFQRRVVVIVRRAPLTRKMQIFAPRLVGPQLMGRSARQRVVTR